MYEFMLKHFTVSFLLQQVIHKCCEVFWTEVDFKHCHHKVTQNYNHLIIVLLPISHLPTLYLFACVAKCLYLFQNAKSKRTTNQHCLYAFVVLNSAIALYDLYCMPLVRSVESMRSYVGGRRIRDAICGRIYIYTLIYGIWAYIYVRSIRVLFSAMCNVVKQTCDFNMQALSVDYNCQTQQLQHAFDQFQLDFRDDWKRWNLNVSKPT